MAGEWAGGEWREGGREGVRAGVRGARRWWVCGGCVLVLVLVTRRFASLRSFVRRFSCLLSELVKGVCIFSCSGCGWVCAIGQVFCASSWYVFSMLMIWSAALSIFFVDIVGMSVSWAR